jgi:predicted aspartyl protease
MLRLSLIAALLLTAAAAPLVPPRTTPNYVSEAAPAHSGDTPAPIESLALTNDQSMRMTVMVKVAGQGPYSFLVDTGSERTAISRQLAAQLKLGSGVPARVHSVLGTETVATVNIPQLGVGGRMLSVTDAPTFESQHIGAEGILGIDMLHAQRVVFDFKAREMQIAPSRYEEFAKLENQTIVVRARSRKGRLILTSVTLDGIPIDAIIDTGSQVSVGNIPLMRQLRRVSQDRIKRTTLRVGEGTAVLEAVTGQVQSVDIARFQRLDLGGVELRDVALAFASARVFEELGYAKRPAILLGMDAMRSFDRVSIDFARKKIRFILPAASHEAAVPSRGNGW